MAKEWTEEELEALKTRAAGKTISELAKSMDRTSQEISDKLVELGFGGSHQDRRQLYDDPLVDAYGKALKQLQQGKFQDAAKTFKKIAAETDLPELKERARQMLAICEAQTAGETVEDVDPFLRAVYEKNRGNYDAAMKICKQGDRLKKDERFAFLAASLHALEKRLDEAAATLTHAVELNPKNRIYAFHDPDFEGLRKEHAEIFDLPA